VAAPLAVYLGVLRSARRDAWYAALLVFVVVMVAAAGPADGFAHLEQAWVVLLTGSLAAVLVSGRTHRFVAAAIATVTWAGGAAAILLVATGRSWGQLVWLAERHYGFLARLMLGRLADVAAGSGTPGGTDLVAALEGSVTLGVRLVSSLFPGLVLLQSLAALALAWALYHRLARHPRGEPLGRLAAFRFNDHLIWGVAISLVAMVLPRLGWISSLGGSLLVFFGGLYVMRGVAVLSAVAIAGGIGGPLVAVLVVFVTVFLLPIAALAALALGLTDTVVDWRGRLARAAQKP
jgi:hypothetical protein